MRRLLLVCVLLLVSACGDESEPRRQNTNPTLLSVEALEVSCNDNGNVFLRLRLRGYGKVYGDEACNGWPTEIEETVGVWEGSVECGLVAFEDLTVTVSDSTSGVYDLRLIEVMQGDVSCCERQRAEQCMPGM